MRTDEGRVNLKAINATNALLGLSLFLSPFLFGFTSEQIAAASAWLSGPLIACIAFIALTELEEWDEWTNLLLGFWVAISPWLFGFAGVTYAKWSHVAIGVTVSILAAVEIWRLHRGPPTKML